MSKFNKTSAPTASGKGFIASEAVSSGRTFEGAPGYKRDDKSELFLLSVANMVGENTFYESAGDRDSRYAQLIHAVALEDMDWMRAFLKWLRSDGNMRTASIVGAVEAVYATNKAGRTGGRDVVSSVLQRPDEPGEALAYFHSRYGRKLPKPIKRGIGDAAVRLYNERSALKYDTASKGYRFVDILGLTHAKPGFDLESLPLDKLEEMSADEMQSYHSYRVRRQTALFKWLTDRRYGRPEVLADLPTLAANQELRRLVAEGDFSPLTDSEFLKAAGMTWEDVLSLAGSKVNKAKLWEALIPSMGYMALLRNLRNFDEAGVSDTLAATVSRQLADPAQVARSRQFPMRFLSAYRAAPSLRWSYPLEQALGYSLSNIPELPGKTVILVDTSGSMSDRFSKDGTLNRADAATLFGLALAQRCADVEVVSFSNRTMVFHPQMGESILRSMERWKHGGFFQGGGTATAHAVQAHYKPGVARVVILTDEQSSWNTNYWGAAPLSVSKSLPESVPLYTWNLAGYEHGHAPEGPNRVTFSGLTDAAFRMIPLLESGRNGAWPWLAK